MLSISLGLCAAGCWGTADFFGGLEARRVPDLLVVLLSQAVGVLLLATLVLATGGFSVGADEALAAAVAGVAAAVGLSCLYRALSVGTMSIVAPIAASGVIVPVLLGLFGGDPPTAIQLGGMAAGAAGLLLVTRTPAAEGEDRSRARQSALLAAAAGLALGVGLAAMGQAAEGGVPSAVLTARATSVALLCVLVGIQRPRLDGSRPNWRRLAAIAALDAGAACFFATATVSGLLSVAAVISSLYPIVTILLASALLRERLRSVQVLGVGIGLAGVAMMAGG